MIQSFREPETERLWRTGSCRKLPANLLLRAAKKLALIHAAENLMQLAALPGNRLEKLSGSRAGQHSIRVNDQYRVCFEWREGHAYEVEVADYH